MGLTLGGSGIQTGLHYLKRTTVELDKSLQRISSGKKILSAADDPGGLMVAMNLENQTKRTDASLSAVQNALSFVEMQASTLQSMSGILDRIQELVDYEHEHSSNSGAISDSEIASYRSEYVDLRAELIALKDAEFNGTMLFNGNSTTDPPDPPPPPPGDPPPDFIASLELDELNDIDLPFISDIFENVTDLETIAQIDLIAQIDSGPNLVDILKDEITGAIGEVASNESVLGFSSEYLSEISLNLETALGRIMDVDLAEETANYAALSMQQEAAVAAVAQANVNMKNVFDLLVSSVGRD